MKSSTQLKALIRNMAKEKRINAQILIRNYMLERLLERISLSKYRFNFILKGGMLVAAMVGLDARATIDMDATIKGYPLSEETIRRVFENIIAIPIDDGTQIIIKHIDPIRDEADYNGLRISLESIFDGIRTPLKIDITAGDKITPREISYQFKLMFQDRQIDICAYNLETVLAEKIETAISRGVTNTRMRDFYDMFILLKMHGSSLDKELLSKALVSTAENRGTSDSLTEGQTIINEISKDVSMQSLWESYREKYSYAEDISWGEVKAAVYQLWTYVSR
ncbi:MAG TPA: nucleotidyl transferase AbiEii/AbiGii toxin family protein [Spirochaetia bacterium]|nr:nucleotidyl transferase AbiEii/AbiGii toxin family protein [Spirochaetia bacterium]